MRVLPWLLLLACGPKTPVPSLAEAPPTEGSAPEEAGVTDKAVDGELFLWEVQGPGDPSYLFGTCHLPIPLEDVLPAEHLDKLTGSRVLYTEVDMDVTSNPIAALETIVNDEMELAEALGREDFRALSIAARPMPASFLAHMTPMGAYMVVSLLRMQREGLEFDPELLGRPGLDAQVSTTAAEAGVERAFLETLEFQLELLSGYDEEFIAAMRPGAKAAEDAGRELDLARDACFSGRSEGLESLLEEPAYRASNYAMIDARNESWMPTVADEVEAGGAFFAVGLMHLLGEGGVVARLRDAGIEVRRVEGARAPSGGVTVSASLDTLVPEASPVDPDTVDAWSARFTDQIVPVVCDGPTSKCMYESPEACRAELATYMPICVDPVVDELGPVDGEGSALPMGMVSTCLQFPATMRVMMSGEVREPEDPICARTKAALDANAPR